jgi:probable phosphoglycerate mutase
MTLLFLVRHGNTDAVGRFLAGRRPGISLNAEGRAQATRAAEALAALHLAAIYTSPLERARETAGAIARAQEARRGPVEVRVSEALTDIDFGEWTGRSIEELRNRPDFHAFNVHRAGARPPGGEPICSVQARFVSQALHIVEAHAGERVALVAHLDPLRSLIGHFVGVPVELQRRLELAPGSISALRILQDESTLLFSNYTGPDLSAFGEA